MSITRRMVVGGLAVVLAGRANACGFDGGLEMDFGIAHPLALHVVLAEREAVRLGVLPQEALKPLLGQANGLWITMDAVSRFASRIAVDPGASVALLMASTGFWARLTWQDGRMTLENHATGPRRDDVLMISDQPVLAALLAGTLSPEQAFSLGLISFEQNDAVNTKISDAIREGFAQSVATRPESLLNSRLPWSRQTRMENRS